jgi:hypothetical protein
MAAGCYGNEDFMFIELLFRLKNIAEDGKFYSSSEQCQQVVTVEIFSNSVWQRKTL